MSGTDHPPSTNGPARSTRSPGPVEQRRRRRGRRRPHQPRLGRQRTRVRRRRRAAAPRLRLAADAGPGRRRPGPRRHRGPRRGRGAPHHRRAHDHHHRCRPPPPRPPPPPPPPAAVAPVATGSGYNDPNNPAAWDRLAQCESGGNWATNTGNGYYGGIQFSLGSWQGVGGTGYPHQASRETQIAMGQRLWNQGGWSHWPACTQQARLPLELTAGVGTRSPRSVTDRRSRIVCRPTCSVARKARDDGRGHRAADVAGGALERGGATRTDRPHRSRRPTASGWSSTSGSSSPTTTTSASSREQIDERDVAGRGVRRPSARPTPPPRSRAERAALERYLTWRATQ